MECFGFKLKIWQQTDAGKAYAQQGDEGLNPLQHLTNVGSFAQFINSNCL